MKCDECVIGVAHKIDKEWEKFISLCVEGDKGIPHIRFKHCPHCGNKNEESR